MRMTILAALAALTANAALAGTPVKQKMTCPIGGKPFDFATTASYSVWGTRADGKPYGSWDFPLALPECPDNGLVLYKDYSAEEVARLTPLVASEAYQALRAAETPYYRAYWLMKEMGLGADKYLWALLQASWEADRQPALRARYLAALVDESARVPAEPASLNWLGMEGRAVNALRELGRFDEALARLDKVPAAALAGGSGEEAVTRKGWRGYFDAQRTVIARRDPGSEPFELLPRREALGRCVEAKGLDAHQTRWCELAKSDVDALRASKAAMAKELETIAKGRENR